MALLRQYSLLGLPHTWKASLIHSYGSLLAQSQNENFSRVGPPSSGGPLFRGGVPGGVVPPNPPPPIPPNMAGLPPTPTLPLVPSAATHNPPPLPPPPAPQSSTSSPLLHQRKATSSCSPRSSPTSSGGVGQTKQRTYPCNECGKIFNAHYNLTRHMPVHTGKKILFYFFVKKYYV